MQIILRTGFSHVSNINFLVMRIKRKNEILKRFVIIYRINDITFLDITVINIYNVCFFYDKMYK